MFDPDRWGLPDEAVVRLGDDLYQFWARYQPCFRTRTRDTSEQAYVFMRGQLTMDDARNYANIDRRLRGRDGQGLPQFVTDSPWAGARVFCQIQADIRAEPLLQHGGLLILDECADDKAGVQSAGAGRQHNGRLGKVDLCQVATCLVYAHPQHAVWALGDSELFIPAAWFDKAHAPLRHEVGLPEDRVFATKPALGLKMIQRVQAQGLPFERVACDDLYGRNRAFRAALAHAGIRYAAEVPATTLVFLKRPVVGVPRQRRRPGRKFSRVKVRSRHRPHTVGERARRQATGWHRTQIRTTERGRLEADFALTQVWTLTPTKQVREEAVVIRRDRDGRLTFVLLNDPADTPRDVLIQASCQRYFTERAFQDAQSELGWDDFQARKYRAWEHEVALTAATLWFIAHVKLKWAQTHARDPKLTRQLAVEVLPALSAANVRELMHAVLPIPQWTRQQARHLVAAHLVKRARSTASRLRSQYDHHDSS